MKLTEFDYHLPPERIAGRPAEPRDSARLLVVRRDRFEDLHVSDLPDLLDPADLVVLNDTRVRPARLFGRRPTGGRIELLLLRRESEGVYQALARANKRLRPMERLELEGGLKARLLERPEGGAVWRVCIEGSEDLESALERVGHVPLPPYIKRADLPEDREKYQTVFARETGSAAAPTAGLHFTPALLERLNTAFVTLHVGYSTFQPIEAEEVEDHRMHAEPFEVTQHAAQRIEERRGRLVAVGTTTARVLESLAASGGVRAARGVTDLYLYPGKRFRVVDALVTNFHLPKSSLLLLVAAFMGLERMRLAYAHAIEQGYRFYSYGDAMLIL